MEPPGRRDREYVATLCALSTIGASATGFTFGFRDDRRPAPPPLSTSTSSKRKTPGSAPTSSKTSSEPSRSTTVRRIVSQPTSAPTTLNGEENKVQRSTSRSLFRRRTMLESEQTSSNRSTSTLSQGSSASGHRRLRSRAGESNGDVRDSVLGSTSWLRRISMISNLSGSPAPSRPDTPSVSLSTASATPMLVNGLGISQLAPNKLVKRSSSHRALSSDSTRLLSLRRPATSHQRSATLQQFSPQEAMPEEISSSGQLWRPYFDNARSTAGAAQPRKRHTSGASRDAVRTLSDARGQQPTLLLGTAVAPRADSDELDDVTDHRTPIPLPIIRRKRRPSSRRDRRVVTDPGLQHKTSPHTMVERSRSSPLSPISHSSTFEIDIPTGTPAFSDPTTASSDKVFTDDDSLDFQSDTAYDSLATRATVSSHSGLRGLQIGTMFDEHASARASNTLVGLEELIEGGSLHQRGILKRPIDSQMDVDPPVTEPMELRGSQNALSNSGVAHSLTPPKMDIDEEDEYAATPVPRKNRNSLLDMRSSPPSMMMQFQREVPPVQEVEYSIAALALDEGDADWDKRTDPDSLFDDASISPDLPMNKGWGSNNHSHADGYFHETDQYSRTMENKPSIFDWSEHHKIGGDLLNGSSPRPKTVHGKQGNDSRGSRTSGRRGPSAVHLRSQSVPVTRDVNLENEPTYPIAAKFGTWGLGNKGPSEEWSDDFDFDDNDEAETIVVTGQTGQTQQNGSVRAMKVPQAIIDRQASVHGQFGQVQEFMLLVEELKRLRLQGSILELLKSQSRQLWEDADSIINLATLNEDEEDVVRPQSPTSPGSFDAFDEVTPPSSHTKQQSTTKSENVRSRTSISTRSISSPSTPPVGRPRGESLAQAKNFLQTIHQKRSGPESSPGEIETQQQKKLPFDTQDLRDLVTRAGVITRALKEIIRKAEGVAVSPTKSPKRFQDPAFSQIFNRPDSSPLLSSPKPNLPKSRSANNYLGGLTNSSNENDLAENM